MMIDNFVIMGLHEEIYYIKMSK